jgi:hypothetical protein
MTIRFLLGAVVLVASTVWAHQHDRYWYAMTFLVPTRPQARKYLYIRWGISAVHALVVLAVLMWWRLIPLW